jgi:hypothetical protein
MSDGDRDPDKERASAGDEMSTRLASRFETDDDEPADESEDGPTTQSQPEKRSKPSKTAQIDKTEQTSVKDRPSVLMYLPEDIHQDLDIRFDELNARYKREHGESLEKNRDYYPAVIEAGLEGKDLEEVLDL